AIANVWLNKFYEEYSGIPYEAFKTQRTNRETIDLAECIPDNVSFKSPNLVDLLKRLKTTVLKKTWDNTKKRWGFKLSEDIVLN
ncbi:hypothetical protein, partial [Streptococcus pneumoniae]|uniref:hypothetical protein n=1 Tax=Streptococcus pneumoniae TaxID=1313 RepID=UPI001E3510A2